jgi:hypothetical protein
MITSADMNDFQGDNCQNNYFILDIGDINMGDNAEYENYRRLEKISWNKVSLCVNF